jgi:hypothetical protein
MLAVLAEHPIRALTWSDQVRARLWVRNGDEVRRLAMVYGSRFWAGLGRDADLAMLQIALSTVPSPHMLALRLLRLGGAACVSPAPRPAPAPAPFTSGISGDALALEASGAGIDRSSIGGGGGSSDDGGIPLGGDLQPSTSRPIHDDGDNARSAAAPLHPAPAVVAGLYGGLKDSVGGLECTRSAARTLVSLARDRGWLTVSLHPQP